MVYFFVADCFSFCGDGGRYLFCGMLNGDIKMWELWATTGGDKKRNIDEALKYLLNGKKNLLIVEKKYENELIKKIKSNNFKIYKHEHKIEGLNYSKGKKVSLSIYSN